jgi:PEP-CTERM motif
MYRRILQLTLAAAVASAPLVLHADPVMTGQFEITGLVQNLNSSLIFSPGATTGTGTQTETFATLLTDGEMVTANSGTLAYDPYPGGFIFNIGGLQVTLDSLTATSEKGTIDFTGIADLSAAGFADTLASFAIQNVPDTGVNGFTAMFTAEAAPPTVPEPSSLALLGSGILGLASASIRKFRSARA